MTDPLYLREEDPVVLDGTIDTNGDLQMLHGSDSLANYDQKLDAEHSDLDQSNGVIRFQLMDFSSGGHYWEITAVHGSQTWARGTNYAYYDFGPLSTELSITITATSNASPPLNKQRTLGIKTGPLDSLPDRPKAAPTDPDLELLRQWRYGDQEAGGKLLAQYFNNLRVFFIQRIPQEETEDLIQEVFRRMVEARDRFEGRSTLRTYLFHIAQNVYFELLRKRFRGKPFDPLTESSATANGRSQSSMLAESERQQLLLEALRNIPGDQQDVIELYHFHGFTTAQLAEHLRVPSGTAKTRLRAARKRLAEAFLEEFKVGGELTDEQLVRDLDQVRGAVWRGQLPDSKKK